MTNFTIMALMAEADHGKDFCGGWIVDNQNYFSIAFADHMKRLCNSVLEFGYIALWGDSKYRNQNMLVDWDRASFRLTWFLDDWVEQFKNLSIEEKANLKPVIQSWLAALRLRAFNSQEPAAMSPRIALQLLGDYGRSFKNNIWISIVLDHMIPEVKNGKDYKPHIGLVSQTWREVPVEGAIITDCRYLNEMKAVQDADGYVIKLIRKSRLNKVNEALKVGIENHSSELEVRNIPDDVYDLVLALEEGEDHVYPRLKEVFDDREFALKKKKI